MIEKVMECPDTVREILEGIEYKEIVKPLVKADRESNPLKHTYPQLSIKYCLPYGSVRKILRD